MLYMYRVMYMLLLVYMYMLMVLSLFGGGFLWCGVYSAVGVFTRWWCFLLSTRWWWCVMVWWSHTYIYGCAYYGVVCLYSVVTRWRGGVRWCAVAVACAYYYVTTNNHKIIKTKYILENIY